MITEYQELDFWAARTATPMKPRTPPEAPSVAVTPHKLFYGLLWGLQGTTASHSTTTVQKLSKLLVDNNYRQPRPSLR